MKIAHVCTPLFAVLLGASVAHAADAASAADPLDALSAFEGKWRCQATHVGLFTDSGTLPTRPTSDDPNAAHGHVFAKRVLNKKWLAIAFFDKHGGDTGGSGDGGDTSTPPQNPETTPSDPGDDLFFSHHGHHHHPSSVSLMGYDAPQHHYVSFAFMNSGAYGVATSDGVTDAGMEWSGAVNDWEGQKVYFRKTLTFSSDGSSFSVKASVSTDGVNWTDHGQGECSKMSSDDHGRGPHHPGHGGHHGDHPADDGGGSDNP